MAAANPYLEDAPSATNPYLELGDNPYLKLGAEPSLTPKTSAVLGEMPAFARSPDIISGEQAKREGLPPSDAPSLMRAVDTGAGWINRNVVAPLLDPIGTVEHGIEGIASLATGKNMKFLASPSEALRVPAISPETVKFFSPLGKTKEGTIAKGVEKFAGEFISGLTSPEMLFGLKAVKYYPELVGRIFQTQMATSIPAATETLWRSIRDRAETPDQVANALSVLAAAGMPVAIERGLRARAAREFPKPPSPPPAEQLAAKVEANKELLPLTAKVVEETVKPARKVERLPRGQFSPSPEPLVKGKYRTTQEMTGEESRAAEAKATAEIEEAWPQMTEGERANALDRGRGIPKRLGGGADNVPDVREPPMPEPPAPPMPITPVVPLAAPAVHAAPPREPEAESSQPKPPPSAGEEVPVKGAQAGVKEPGLMTPDEAVKSGVDRGDYYRAVEQEFKDGRITESDYVARSENDPSKWPKFKIGQDVFVRGQWSGPAKVTDVGYGWLEVIDNRGAKSRQDNASLNDLAEYYERHPDFKPAPQPPAKPAAKEAVAPVAEAKAEVAVPSFGQRYISENGLEAAQSRVAHLDARVQEELRQRPVNNRAVENLSNEASNLRKAIARAEPARTTAGEGQRPGPGAMTAGELLPEEAFITSIKNAWTDADAARFGLEPVERGERRHWRDTVIPEAEAEILNNPQAAEGIMAKVKADPNYRMQDVETAILLQRKADIINEMNRASKRLSEAREIKHVENEITEMVRINDLSDSLQEIRDVSKEAGTPLGQALAARKMLMREDYSLATLVARKASALGRPLEPAELAKIEALEAKIKDLEAKLKAGEEAKSQEGRKGQEEQTHDETVKAARSAKAKGEKVDSITEGQNIIDRMKKRVEEGDTAEDLYAFVQKLHENLQRQALDQQGTPLSRVEVVDAIHNILTKDLGLNLPKEFTGTERVPNTSDLISGIGRTTPLTTDTAKLAKLDVREQEQKVGKINRYLNKLAAPKTGPERKKSSAEARQLEKEGRRLAREMGIRVTDPATQLANSLSAIKTRLRNEIEEIDLAIASKKPLVKKDGGVAYDAEATALRARRDAKKADYDALFPKEPLTEAEQIQRAGKVLDRQIAEVERQLKSGEIFQPGRTPKPELRSAALDAQRSRLEALKQERAYARDLIQPKPEIKSSEELALQGWRTRTTHRIADLQERIAKGDFATRKRQPVQPTSTADLALKAELKKIKDEFDIGVNRDRLANRTRAAKVWDGVKRTLGSPRQLMSSWDLSAVLRQGGFIGFGHPARSAKALKPMLDALRSDMSARIEEQKIFDRENYKNGLYQRAKLYLAPLEGMKPSRAEEVFIPSYAERVLGVQASQRAYVTFLNKLRTDSFDAMVTGFAKRGKGLNDVELRAIANYVNAATGRGNLGKFAAAGEGLSMAFFSPRLVASRFQLIAGEPLMRGSMATRRAIAEEYARFAIGLGVVYGLGALAGAEIETDPRSPDFGKLRFGKTRVDPLTGIAQSTVLISRLITGEKVTARGKGLPIRGKVPFGSPDAYEVGADWLRTKFSPIFGAAVTATTGKHPGGELATPGSIAKGLLVPLAWQDVLSVMEEQGVPRGAAIEILSLLGMGVQNYDEQRKVR